MKRPVHLKTNPIEGAEKETCENDIDAFVQPPGRLFTEEPVI